MISYSELVPPETVTLPRFVTSTRMEVESVTVTAPELTTSAMKTLLAPVARTVPELVSPLSSALVVNWPISNSPALVPPTTITEPWLNKLTPAVASTFGL